MIEQFAVRDDRTWTQIARLWTRRILDSLVWHVIIYTLCVIEGSLFLRLFFVDHGDIGRWRKLPLLFSRALHFATVYDVCLLLWLHLALYRGRSQIPKCEIRSGSVAPKFDGATELAMISASERDTERKPLLAPPAVDKRLVSTPSPIRSWQFRRPEGLDGAAMLECGWYSAATLFFWPSPRRPFPFSVVRLVGYILNSARPLTALRLFVATNKRLFDTGNHVLDLSYVTSRVIAMALPAEGRESLLRMPAGAAARYLNEVHPGKHLVYNLCAERYYNRAYFNRVQLFPCLDHQVMPLHKMREFCATTARWLAEDPQRVIAVHCKGGKGRTGLLISAWLLYSGFSPTPLAALKHYGDRRTDDAVRCGKMKTVTNACQIRYLCYFHRMLRNEVFARRGGGQRGREAGGGVAGGGVAGGGDADAAAAAGDYAAAAAAGDYAAAAAGAAGAAAAGGADGSVGNTASCDNSRPFHELPVFERGQLSFERVRQRSWGEKCAQRRPLRVLGLRLAGLNRHLDPAEAVLKIVALNPPPDLAAARSFLPHRWPWVPALEVGAAPRPREATGEPPTPLVIPPVASGEVGSVERTSCAGGGAGGSLFWNLSPPSPPIVISEEFGIELWQKAGGKAGEKFIGRLWLHAAFLDVQIPPRATLAALVKRRPLPPEEAGGAGAVAGTAAAAGGAAAHPNTRADGAHPHACYVGGRAFAGAAAADETAAGDAAGGLRYLFTADDVDFKSKKWSRICEAVTLELTAAAAAAPP